MRSLRPSVLDVRPLIARGEEPLPVIQARLARLGPDETLTVVAPFLPSPLIERMRGEGFGSRINHQADGGWAVTFQRE